MQLRNKYWIIKKAFPKHLCNNIISYGLQKKISKGVIVGNEFNKGIDNSVRNSNVIWLDEHWLYLKLAKIVSYVNYAANWNFEISTPEVVQFTIYDENMHYDWHEDAFEEPYGDNVDNKSIIGKTRKISLSLLLNDPKKYKGGEFEVDFGNRAKPVKTCSELSDQGDCVVFPSDLLHRVRPVSNGIRYSLVLWTLGKPFK